MPVDIRITSDDQATIKRLGCETPMLAALKALSAALHGTHYSEIWVKPVGGLFLFHVRHKHDPRGQYRRVAVGVNDLKALAVGASPLLHPGAITPERWAEHIVARIEGRKPPRPLAVLPAGLPRLGRPLALVHHDTAVPA